MKGKQLLTTESANLERGNVTFSTSGTGTVTIEVTINADVGASIITLTAPEIYTGSLPDCLITVTITETAKFAYDSYKW